MSLGPLPFTLRQLQYAVAVADALSFRQAAQRCHVSQPSLSAQIAELESGLGVQLFERDRRRVLITAAGHEILERARWLLRDSDDLVELARRSADPLTGTLRIGVIPTVSPYLLPRLSPALRKAHPELSVLWVEDKTEVLVGRLEAGTLDTALLALEAEIGDVASAVVGFDPFVLATPEDHLLGAAKSAAKQSELDEQDVLLLDDGHCFRDQALAVCSSAKAHELEFRATSLPTLAQMVAGGAGITLLPQMAVPVEAKRADLRVRPFEDPPPGRTIALVWRKRSPLGPALRELATTLRDAYDRPETSTPRRRTSKAGKSGKKKRAR